MRTIDRSRDMPPDAPASIDEMIAYGRHLAARTLRESGAVQSCAVIYRLGVAPLTSVLPSGHDYRDAIDVITARWAPRDDHYAAMIVHAGEHYQQGQAPTPIAVVRVEVSTVARHESAPVIDREIGEWTEHDASHHPRMTPAPVVN
jgi:hypothetical protein